MRIAALQLSTLPLSNSKLDNYLQTCSQKGVRIVVLAEYVINTFFKELQSMPKMLIAEQSRHKIEALSHYASTYNLIIIAPIVLVENGKIYKAIGKFTTEGVEFVNQNFLINYTHWDEDSFFDNEKSDAISFIHFEYNGITYAAINGFDIHFDQVWIEMVKKGVDVVLVPSVSTFGSNQRWNEILKSRALLNSMYILRVNRVGTYNDDESLWKFYGETYLINPFGEIEKSLNSKEELLIININKNEVNEARDTWKFQEQLKVREII